MRTNIYGTIGPACRSVETLRRLFAEGMTGVRLNLSHTSLADAADWIANIHHAYESQSGGAGTKGAEILMDLQGPELRIGTLRESRQLSEGEKVILADTAGKGTVGVETIPVPGFILPHLTRGQELLLDDGQLLLMVEETLAERERGAVSCTVVRGGCLRSRKSIALPGASWKAPTLTDCDLRNIRDARRFGITGVMLPFVRSAADLCCLRETLESEHAGDVRIFAKIENMDGVESLPELLAHCDEVVIARGDLGNSVPLWKLPVVQARLAEICRRAGKPFMVVTQMLASMETKQIPTRAEVSDIFCAVAEGASSVMLTGETAAGNYPVEAMHYLVQTVRETEAYMAESDVGL